MNQSDMRAWRCSLDLLKEPPQETVWLIDRLIPSGCVVLFSGREGTMKTWLALDWARAVAEGTNWLSRPCEAGGVLYLDAEMPKDLFLSRLHGIGGSTNLNIWRWQDTSFPVTLTDRGLRVAAQSHRLIVVDTLRRFMGDKEENSSTDMADITKSLRQLTRSGATVIVLHHAKKDPEHAGYRGSTELGAGVDIVLHIERTDRSHTETLTITTPKTRYEVTDNLSLQVERPGSRPVFQDLTGVAQTSIQAAQDAELERLQGLILELKATSGHKPNQTEVVRAAKQQGLGSRGTILRWLGQGDGTWWRSETDGRSRVYEAIVQLSTFPEARGPDRLDNG